jgi:hypothetical protein
LENRLADGGLKLSLQPSANIFIQRINHLEKSNVKLRNLHLELKDRVQQLEEDKEKSAIAQEPRVMQPPEPQADMGNQSHRAESSLPIDKLQQHVREQNSIIAKIKTENEQKDKKIAALRSDAINYQMRNPPVNCGPKPSFTNGWVDDDCRSGGTTAESEMSIELQQQLQDMQQILCRKEQELSTERKRFAVRESTLLARLREAFPEQRVDLGQLRFFL